MAEPPDWHGREIAAADGTPYGRLDDLFVGSATGEPEFGVVTVDAEGGGTKQVAVPLRGARLRGDVLQLPLDPDRVRAAPAVRERVETIPPESGERVLAFFGLGGEAPTTPMPPVHPPAGDPARADDAVEAVLSEERLDVGTERRAAERVRIRKQVVTEEVTLTVELRREELVIEREPIGPDEVGLAPCGAIGEGEDLVVVLHAEEPVVDRRVVPVERVRLRRDTVVEQATVTEPVRREEAEVEHIPLTEDHPT